MQAELVRQAAARFQTQQEQASSSFDITDGAFAVGITPAGPVAEDAALAAKSKVLAADASPSATATQQDVIQSISQERVIGKSDLIDVNFLEMAIAVARGVGRVRLLNEFGTGFLVGPGLMMTNHHVLGSDVDSKQAQLQMDHQDNADGEILPTHSYRLDPGRFFLSDKDLDFTIVGVEPVSDKGRALDQYPWIKLSADGGKAAVGDCVNIVQHPRGELKQIAFRENTVIAIPQGQPQFLYYTTDTEPGSSGSPCFNDQWDLVALHHSGVAAMDAQQHLLKKDGTIWLDSDDPSLLKWIANEGIRIPALLDFLKKTTLKSEWQDLLGKALTGRAPNPIEVARSVDSKPAAVTVPAPIEQPDISKTSTESIGMNNSFTWTIPLQVTVTLGQIANQATAAVTTVAPVASETPTLAVAPSADEAVVVDQDYKGRPGYDVNFLGISVPLPVISEEMKPDTSQVDPDFRKNGNLFELAYYNYSVYMNKKRRTAWFSAANVDGDNRPDIGSRAGDRWYNDTRIPRDDQFGQEAFEPGIDRGHLTRREDTAWGKDVDSATKSNNDTFHFTNCSLQASPFNRGKERWQGLEQFMLEQHAKKDKRRIVVITGPVFADGDPTYRNPKMKYAVKCPLKFWKVCVLVKQDGTPSATAFVLGQDDIKALPNFEEAFDVGATQITIADLENRTGLNFGDLKKHDHFAETHQTGTLEADQLVLKAITRNEDIVV